MRIQQAPRTANQPQARPASDVRGPVETPAFATLDHVLELDLELPVEMDPALGRSVMAQALGEVVNLLGREATLRGEVERAVRVVRSLPAGGTEEGVVTHPTGYAGGALTPIGATPKAPRVTVHDLSSTSVHRARFARRTDELAAVTIGAPERRIVPAPGSGLAVVSRYVVRVGVSLAPTLDVEAVLAHASDGAQR